MPKTTALCLETLKSLKAKNVMQFPQKALTDSNRVETILRDSTTFQTVPKCFHRPDSNGLGESQKHVSSTVRNLRSPEVVPATVAGFMTQQV